eukprot:1401122-Amphidinium_carterae.1
MSEYLHVNVDIQPCPQTIGTVLTCDLRPMRALDCQSLGEAGVSSWRVSLAMVFTALRKSGLRKHLALATLSIHPRASEQMSPKPWIGWL